MKKYILLILIIVSLESCQKGESYRPNSFPGITGSEADATWVVFRHTATDPSYLTIVLPKLNPPTTYVKYDSTLIASRQREVAPFSYKFYKSGEVATIQKSSSNQSVWVKISSLKWQQGEGFYDILANINGAWISVITGFKDEEKLLLKYKKSFYGDATSEKDKYVLEVFYTIYK